MSGTCSCWVHRSSTAPPLSFAMTVTPARPGSSTNTARAPSATPDLAGGTFRTAPTMAPRWENSTSMDVAGIGGPGSTGSHVTVSWRCPSSVRATPIHTSAVRLPGCCCASESSATATRGSSTFDEAAAAASISFWLGAQ